MAESKLFRPDHSGLLSLFAPVYGGSGQALVTSQQATVFSDARSDKESFYFRDGLNPTVNHVENKLRRIYGVPEARLVQSGMSAISVAILSLLTSGARVLISSDCFVDTQLIGKEHLRRWGVQTERFHLTEKGQLPVGLLLRTNDIVVVESISNPMCRQLDLQHLQSLCDHAGAFMIVDNTLPSSLIMPIQPNAHCLVVESLTKYHLMNTGWAGVVLCSDEHKKSVHEVIKLFGFAINAEIASRLEIGLQTLGLRLKTQIKNRNVVREHLQSLEFRHDFRILNNSNPDSCPFIVLQFRNESKALKVLNAFQVILPSPSFGGPQSMACLGNFHVTEETNNMLAERGVDSRILRLCIGLEDSKQISEDLVQALEVP